MHLKANNRFLFCGLPGCVPDIGQRSVRANGRPHAGAIITPHTRPTRTCPVQANETALACGHLCHPLEAHLLSKVHS